jgi:hypothetical protein
MSKSLDDFCNLIKKQFPEISEKADREYARQWDDIQDSEFYSYSWFEALSNALNREMCRATSALEYCDLFSTISSHFETGDDDIKKCVDVAFVENLFWEVPKLKSEPYWKVMPENLKQLYLAFHRRPPF